MANEDNLNDIRKSALDEIDARQKVAWRILMVAGLVEGIALVAYLVLMDFSNRLHWLILIAAGLVYCTLALGLMALSAASREYARKILLAVQALGAPADRRES